MKSLFYFLGVLLTSLITSCKKNEISLRKLIKESGDDSMIAQVLYYNSNGDVNEITDYTYNSSNMLTELNFQRIKRSESYKLSFSYSFNEDTVTCFSDVAAQSYTAYFKNGRLIEKRRIKNINGPNDQSINFLYNLDGEVVEELNIINKVDTSILKYAWNNGNIERTELVEYNEVGTFRYDNAKSFTIGDVFYIYYLNRFGRIPFKANKNQCLTEVINEFSQLDSWRDIHYSYDSKGRISGYDISNNGGSIKYIYR